MCLLDCLLFSLFIYLLSDIFCKLFKRHLQTPLVQIQVKLDLGDLIWCNLVSLESYVCKKNVLSCIIDSLPLA